MSRAFEPSGRRFRREAGFPVVIFSSIPASWVQDGFEASSEVDPPGMISRIKL